jgi:hypothetical protein
MNVYKRSTIKPSSKKSINKKFWEELISYFILILQGPHTKRLQQFFAAAETSFPSCYLAKIGRYTDPQTHASKNPTVAAGTCLPSSCLATTEGIHIQTYRHTDWWEGFMREIKRRVNSGNACYHSVQKLLSSRLLSKNIKIRIYKTIILPVVLYRCETWSLTLREEHRLRVFENRVLRRIFGPKRDEVRGGWRKLHNEELHCFRNSLDIPVARFTNSRPKACLSNFSDVRSILRLSCRLVPGFFICLLPQAPIPYAIVAFRTLPMSLPERPSFLFSVQYVFSLYPKPVFPASNHFCTVGHPPSGGGQFTPGFQISPGPYFPEDVSLVPCHCCMTAHLPAGGSPLPPGSTSPRLSSFGLAVRWHVTICITSFVGGIEQVE